MISFISAYPFFRGAARARARRAADTDALVTSATIASLFLREQVVALVVLLNIGELLQEVTLQRTRRLFRSC
jgi:cation-transporting P-type ATPase C